MLRTTLVAVLAIYAFSVLPIALSDLPTSQANAMLDLCDALNQTLGWNCDQDPCGWPHVYCDSSNATVLQLIVEPLLTQYTAVASLPESFADLVDLEVVVFHGIGIVSPLPTGLGALNALQRLDLSANLIDGVFPALSNTNMKYLNASFNRFSGGFPVLDTLPALETLDLSSNQFTGPIPANAFENNTYLSTFICSNNSLSGNITFALNREWIIIDVSQNELDICSFVFVYELDPPTATNSCDFSSQTGEAAQSCEPSAQFTAFWSNCSIIGSFVEPKTEVNLETLVHCWEVVGSDTYAYFGFETDVAIAAVDVEWTVTNGVLEVSPESAAVLVNRKSLVLAVKVLNDSEIVTLSVEAVEEARITLLSNASSAVLVGNDAAKCPEIPLAVYLNYPSSTVSVTHLETILHLLYSSSMPYPFDLLSLHDLTSSERDSLAAGTFSLNIVPEPTSNHSSFLAAAKLDSLARLYHTSETGPADGMTYLISDIPTSGGSLQPISAPSSTPTTPPSLSRSAKGAIAICVIVGFLIFILTGFLFCLRPPKSRLPIVSQAEQDKVNRTEKPSKTDYRGIRHMRLEE